MNSVNYFFARDFIKIPSFVLGIFALGLLVFSQLFNVEDVRTNPLPIAPPEIIEHISFGFQEAVADALWIRSLQGFDFCDQSQGVACANNSWLYKMLDAVTDLSPKFRIPYAAGGLALTVILSDYEGATKIFEKGVAAFPKDWPIAYRAGYHYLYEVKDNKRAAELFIRAANNGGPGWLYSLAGRLYSDSGSMDVAEKILEEMIKTEQDPAFIERLRQKIESMKKKTQ